MRTAPERPEHFWTDRRSVKAAWATIVIGVAVIAAAILYAAPWRPAYIQSVSQCNLTSNQICLDVHIAFNRDVANGTLDLLAVALQSGVEVSRQEHVNPTGFVPGDELIWSVIIPVNGSVIASYSFQFTLFVNSAQVDSRTVGYQGG